VHLRSGAAIAGLLLSLGLIACSSGLAGAADAEAATQSSPASDPAARSSTETADADVVARAVPDQVEAQSTATVDVQPTPFAGIPERSGLPTAPNGLIYSGPTPRSHWHAAYVVRACDEVLDPLSDVDNQVGIHTHDDGVIHIHPGPEATYTGATLGRFLEAAGARISTGRLELPGREPLVDGDMCSEGAGRVAVYRWDSFDAELPSEVIRQDPQTARFLTDGEMFTVSFAPEGAPIVKPFATAAMLNASPALQEPEPEPFVDLPSEIDETTFRIWPVLNKFPPLAEPPADAASLSAGEFALAVCGPTAIPSSDGSLCYERTTPVLAPDAIVDVSARSIGSRPGFIIEITDFAMEDLNSVIQSFAERGGIEIGVEVNEEVLIVALAPQPFVDNRIAIAGGMTPEIVKTLEALLGRTI